LEHNNKKITTLLFALQGVGAVFVGIFLAAYLGGMFMTPSTTVLHSEPAFRIPLTILGVILLILILVIVVLSFYKRPKLTSSIIN
jgi:uncharacterized iron-regulated membrane protein